MRNQRSETVLLRLSKAVSFCVLERSKRQDERFEKFAINYKNKKRTHRIPPKDKSLAEYSSGDVGIGVLLYKVRGRGKVRR